MPWVPFLYEESDEVPPVAPVVPLRDGVLFPGAITVLTLGRPRSIAAARAAVESGTRLAVVVAQRDEDDDEAADLHEVGCLAELHLSPLERTGDPGQEPLPEVWIAAAIGRARVRLVELVGGEGYAIARLEALREQPAGGLSPGSFERLRSAAARVHRLQLETRSRDLDALYVAQGPGRLADAVASGLAWPLPVCQRFLEELADEARIRTVLESPELVALETLPEPPEPAEPPSWWARVRARFAARRGGTPGGDRDRE